MQEDPLRGYNPDTPDDFQGKFMNMLFLLALLIGFMLLASWMLKRMTRTRAASLNQGSDIKILETRNLSPRTILHLIECQGKNLLVAETQMGVSLLSTHEKNTFETEYQRPTRIAGVTTE